MTAHHAIDIYEFSTGIEVKRTATGWESGGFTGEYMNRTLDSIPQGVLDAIANREFALAEGSSTETPAMVGREVTAYNQTWSVVAVVTRGMDDRGRGVSLYRYFLCQGAGHIGTILRWMGSPPKAFDPFDKKMMGQPARYLLPQQVEDINFDKKPELKALLGQPSPIIVPASQACMPLILNQMTKELPNSGGRSWAYKVAALEYPEYFQVIYPADAKAEDILRQVLTSRPNRPTLITGDAAIKAAIKAIINGRLKPEHMPTFEDALKNPQIDQTYWKETLNKQGADQALKGNLYGDRNIRLLTLKAILQPKFLPDFLGWLYVSKESDKHYRISMNLQQNILGMNPSLTGTCPQITENLKEGICIVFACLVKAPQIVQEASFLLIKHDLRYGLWSWVYKTSLEQEMNNDLELMKESVRKSKTLSYQSNSYTEVQIESPINFIGQGSDNQNLSSSPRAKQSESQTIQYEAWNNLLKKIRGFWNDNWYHNPNSDYLPLAKLFELSENYEFAALFYQLSQESVPKLVYKRASLSARQSNLFGIKIRCQKTPLDYVAQILNFEIPLRGKLMRIYVALFLLLFGGMFGGMLGWSANNLFADTGVDSYKESQRNGHSQQNDPANNHQSNSNQSGTGGTLAAPSDFDRTDEAIDAITSNLNTLIQNLIDSKNLPQEIQNNPTYNTPKNVVIFCTKKTFAKLEINQINPNFPYDQLGGNKEEWKNFSVAIETYQKTRGATNIDGVIDKNGETQKWLEEDIRECLKPSSDTNSNGGY